MTRFALTVLAVCASLVGCGGDNPTGPSSGPPFSTTDLVVGNGPEAMDGQQLTVSYTGWLYDSNAPDNKGSVFDSGAGFRFRLGAGQVIVGWDQGFVGMRVGGMRRLVIPPDLAYGSQGQGSIPPNATLIFEVTLTAVQ